MLSGLARVALAGSGMLFVIALQLCLGAERAGVVFFAQAVIVIAVALGSAGIGLGASRRLAWLRAAGQGVAGAALAAQGFALAMGGLAALALLGWVRWGGPERLGVMPRSGLGTVLQHLALAVPALALVRVQGEALKGLARPILGQSLQVAAVPTLASVWLLWARLGGPVTPLFAADLMVGASALAAVLGGFALQREVLRRTAGTTSPRPRLAKAPATAPRGGLVALWSFELLMLISSRSGSLVLGFFESGTAVTRFELALRIASVATLVLGGVNAALTPRLVSTLRNGGREELGRLARHGARCGFLLVTPLLLLIPFGGMALIARTDAGLEGLGWGLAFLCGAEWINAATGPATLLLLFGGQEGGAARSALLSTCAGLLGLLVLVPAFGLVGAAAAVAGGGALLNLLNAWRVRRDLGVWTLAGACWHADRGAQRGPRVAGGWEGSRP